jgi:hypothetical protein
MKKTKFKLILGLRTLCAGGARKVLDYLQNEVDNPNAVTLIDPDGYARQGHDMWTTLKAALPQEGGA